MPTANQTPEQAARDRIDEMLYRAGWVVQDNRKIDFGASPGIAVREYQADVGPADYVLFVTSEYDHEQAVADGVNAGNEIYVIDTESTRHGGQLGANQQVEKRERLTRRRRWMVQDEDTTYAANQLDRSVVNPDQIRTVFRAFREKRPEILPGRREVPKTRPHMHEAKATS